MEKGNKSINKSMVKTIFEGNILITLPKVLVGNRFHSMFSIISPTHCDFCGTKLNVNSHYTRFILTSYGNITRNTTYWICPNRKKNFHDQIVGVYRSANYSDEFGSVAKNLAPLQNQKKPSQLGKLIIFIRKKIIHKGENYSVKLQKYNFCNGTVKRATNVPVSYTHLRAHETGRNLVCRLLL